MNNDNTQVGKDGAGFYSWMVQNNGDSTPWKYLCTFLLLHMILLKVLVSTEKTATHCLTLYSSSPVLSDCWELDSGWTTAARYLWDPIRPGPTPFLQFPVGGYLLNCAVWLWTALLALRRINFISSSAINSVPHVFSSIASYSKYSNCALNVCPQESWRLTRGRV